MAAIINLVDSDSESDVEYVCETGERSLIFKCVE